MEIKDYKFEEALTLLAWSLWTELGVRGNQRWHRNCLISLEELILLTAVIAEYDPRLRDEALDWCSRYHHYVSVTRLRTLIKKAGGEVAELFSVFAATLNTVVPAHWPIFSKVKPLSYSPTEKSTLPNLQLPALLQIHLRSIFGVGARADLFAFLLTQVKGDFNASEAACIGYSKRSVADLLDHLVLAGILQASNVANQKRYTLSDPKFLGTMVRELPKIAPAWDSIILFLLSVRSVLNASEEMGLASKIVKFQHQVNIVRNRLHLNLPPSQRDLQQYWDGCVDWILSYVRDLTRGGFGGLFVVGDLFKQHIGFLMQRIYAVDDCLDGMEFIFSKAMSNLNHHAMIYGESVNHLLRYTQELVKDLNELLAFPFYELMDYQISELVFSFSKSTMKEFEYFADEFEKVGKINSAYQALKQYELHQSALNKIYIFKRNLNKRIQELYLAQTDIHLLTASPTLYKRHEVMKLYP